MTFNLKKVESLFKDGPGVVVTKVLERADPRIEILRLYSPQKKNLELDDVGKYRQYFADRSLALSHEAYGGSIAGFVRSLRQVGSDDQSIAVEGTKRGNRYRSLEKAVGAAGASALAAYELSNFRKIGNDDIDKAARCIVSKLFEEVLESAKRLTEKVEAAQLEFDKVLQVPSITRPLGKPTTVYTT
jgi:hypothetical protein